MALPPAGEPSFLHRHSWPPVHLVHITLQTMGFALFHQFLQPLAVDLDAAGVGLRQGVFLEDPAHVMEQTGDTEKHIGRPAAALLSEERVGVGIPLK